MLCCETYPDLRDRQITKIKTEFPPFLGEVRSTAEDGLCFFLDESLGGGMIALRNLDDPTKYQSAEFAAIAVDELTKISKDTFDILRGSLRWPGIDHTVFISASNPGGIGHGWVKQLWLDRDFPPEMASLADQFAFIKALPADNPYLPETYWQELNSLPMDLRRAWVEGDWTVFAGQFFDRWREDVHIIPRFQLDPLWKRIVAIDYGTTNPFCALWGAVDYDNNIYIYREVYRSGLTANEQARLIKENTPAGEKITAYVADPSMVNIKSQFVGNSFRSIANFYSDEGLSLLAGNNDRIHGWNAVREYLDWTRDDAGDLVRPPKIRVFQGAAPNLVRTLPSMVHDETKVEDMDTDGEDHACDALRYLTMYAYKPSRPVGYKPGKKDHGIGDILNRMHNKQTVPQTAEFV